MAFLLILPSAVFALVALPVAAVLIHVEIAERRRAKRHFRRRGFRPVVIAGGKGKTLPAGQPQPVPDDASAEPDSTALVPLRHERRGWPGAARP